MEHCFADVIVIGGGHAGIEAANAVHKMGLKVRLLSMSASNVGTLSGNPAVGGTAKGQVVKEIDALGGLMGEITDECSLQFKMLNKSKGPAVWSPRSQVSRSRYPLIAQRRLRELDPEMIVEATIDKLLIEDGCARGVVLSTGSILRSRSVIVCAGTFLNAVMHTGLTATRGGRYGERPTALRTLPEGALKLETGRLKTGTPPRISLKSIDTTGLETQLGDTSTVAFSSRTVRPLINTIPCWITHTSQHTHRILESGFDESPMFTGKITGKGPRYCPSIEDKIARFADKSEHHIFLEPEDDNGDVVYVNGFSTSLPAKVQIDALRTLPGLERVEMIRAGYAVEYDYFPAYQLDHTLESKQVQHLYFAGQVNGTSGYEEAAAQGIIAGINSAAKLLGKPAFTLGRDEGYIGVLVDDLINKVQDEPYRLFTSSAEHRLLLRQDNADLRLGDKAYAYGLITSHEYTKLEQKRELLKLGLFWAETERVIVSETPKVRESAKSLIKSRAKTVSELLTASTSSVAHTLLDHPEIQSLIEIEIVYEGYVARHYQQIQKAILHEEKLLPKHFAYDKLTALSKESIETLEKVRPVNLGQASRLAGVSPSDISVLLLALQKDSSFHVEH